MTEFALIVGIDGLGFLLAFLVWRSLSRSDAGSPAVRRLAGAIERAARRFSGRQWRVLAATTGALLLLSIFVSVAFATGGPARSRLEVGVWTGVCLAFGASAAGLCGYVGSRLAARGSARAAVAANAGVDAALSVAMRAAGAAAIFAEASSGLGLTLLLALSFGARGGFARQGAARLTELVGVVGLLPAFALGAAGGALVVQRGGGTFQAASGLGSRRAVERAAGLRPDDARNPAAVAELTGDCVGAAAMRSVESFASACLANVAAMTACAALASSSRAAGSSRLIALPLVLRAFGLLSSGFGLWLVRSTEGGRPSFALLRGYVSTTAIALSANFGVSYWLLGERFLRAGALGALGLGSALAATQALPLMLGGRFAPQPAAEGARAGGGSALASGLSVGSRAALVPLVTWASAAGAAAFIARGSSDDTPLGLLAFVLPALATSPFVIGVATLGSVVAGARGIQELTSADNEAKRRSLRLEHGSFLASAAACQHTRLASAASSLLAVWVIAGQGRASAAPTAALLALIGCAALGAAVTVGYAGSVTRAALASARQLGAEIERQWHGFAQELGLTRVPRGFTPSYGACVDLLSVGAFERALGPMLLSLVAPVAVALGLRGLVPGLVAQGLSWYVAAAVLVGSCGALAAEALRAVLGASRHRDRKHARRWGVGAEAASEVMANAAAPAFDVLVKATAAAALSFTPFLN